MFGKALIILALVCGFSVFCYKIAESDTSTKLSKDKAALTKQVDALQTQMTQQNEDFKKRYEDQQKSFLARDDKVIEYLYVSLPDRKSEINKAMIAAGVVKAPATQQVAEGK